MAAGLASDVASAAGQRVSRKAESVSDAFHAQAAQRMLGVLGEMKGLPLKAGQMLSFIDEALPEDQRHLYREALGRLQRSAPPLPWDDIETVFREDFDGRGPDAVFARFDREPIAAASIGQVYRAALADGTEVAVKVQYPGIREAMAADVANIDVLVAAMSTVLPRLSIRSFVHDLVARIEDELDYEAEAAAQARFAAVWAEDPQVMVPAVFPELSSGRVLTSEWVEGMSWDTLLSAASAAEQSAYGLVIFRFVFGSLFRHGMFNGDPHPGNYLFLPHGRVAFIDYGCTLSYDPDRAAALRRLADTCVARDTGPAFDRAVREAFCIPDDFDPEMAAVLVDYV
ncbi:MAG: putative unusual protein kinase regulating ubiquinone biosynthesis (AarF/ABC1/UbiB family), partial [Myxococcota bacterium]